jgi:phosphotriesterase-related protein
VGGCAVLDCQPGECGRNANRLAELSQCSGIILICATGFHRRRYYAPDHWLWSADADCAAGYFTGELLDGVEETLDTLQPVRAGFIKVACEATLADTPLRALQGAAQAAASTGAAIQVHTEKGASAEAILEFLLRHGVPARQVVLCHMDKRPDFGLHRDLVQAGALLEYDTFYRPKYEPERHLWPLLEKMASAGLENGVALATDIAEAALWAHLGSGPGLAGFVSIICPRLEAAGLSSHTVQRMLGGNITERLAPQ